MAAYASIDAIVLWDVFPVYALNYFLKLLFFETSVLCYFISMAIGCVSYISQK